MIFSILLFFCCTICQLYCLIHYHLLLFYLEPILHHPHYFIILLTLFIALFDSFCVSSDTNNKKIPLVDYYFIIHSPSCSIPMFIISIHLLLQFLHQIIPSIGYILLLLYSPSFIQATETSKTKQKTFQQRIIIIIITIIQIKIQLYSFLCLIQSRF